MSSSSQRAATPRVLAALIGALPLLALPPRVTASTTAPATLAVADRLAASSPGPDRDRALTQWGRHATLPELMFVLRRSGAELGGVQSSLIEAALERAPQSRPVLRQRLILRLAAAGPKRVHDRWREFAVSGARLPARPLASVFRVAALLPDSGDYHEYGRALRIGLAAGLADSLGQHLALELRFLSTGDDQPALAAAALDSASVDCGALVGALLSVPTFAVAAGAHVLGLPLISPTATDEAIGLVGRGVFQIGPAGFRRGEELARVVLHGAPRAVGILISSAVDRGSFALGFASAAESLGSHILWRDSYPAGSADFRAVSHTLKADGIELLFWDGEPREAEALVRQLARDGASIRLVGGEGLSPDQFHAESRALLEGVQYVGDDWRLSAAAESRLDSLAHAQGEEHPGPLHARGYLAGRLLASAVSEGALCPEELAEALARHLAAEPYLRERGFLDLGDDARLPVFTVMRGHGVLLP